jgi:hypothetical protein
MHGASIAVVALTEDGLAAATSDTSGMIRLWVTLDGTHEPFVVPGPSPTQLAIVRDHDRFAIAAADEAGTMTVMVVGADGRLRKRTQVTGDQQVLQIEATPLGFLALRSDQSIELVTVEGKPWSQLSAEHRVAALLYRNNRALALFETSPHHFTGRWIELVSGAHWGDETPEVVLDLPKHTVLAPDHKHVAAIATDKLVAIELATGTVSATIPGKGDPLGYSADGVIACSDETGVVYWSEDGKRLAHVELGFAPDDSPTAVATGRVATASNRSLALVDQAQKTPSYLGYQIDVPTRIRSASAGFVVGELSKRWVIDQSFRLEASLSIPHDEYTEILDAMPVTDKVTVAIEAVDETRWLTSIPSGKLYVGVRDDAIHFDAKTRILAEGSSGQTIFMRVSEDGAFSSQMSLLTSTSPLAQYLVDTTEDADRVFLVDPELAHGLVALVVHGHRIYEIADEDLAGSKIKARRNYTFTGGLVAVDRAGRLYTRASGTASTDVVVKDGTNEVLLAGSRGGLRVIPNADGSLVAILGSELALYSGDGTLKWKIAAKDMTGVAWQGNSLVGVSEGVVRIDLATGAYGERQCGWRFGLFPKPPPTPAEHRLVCDA